MSSIYFRPPKSGDKLGMKYKFIQKSALFQPLNFTVFAQADFTVLALLLSSDRYPEAKKEFAFVPVVWTHSNLRLFRKFQSVVVV